MPELPGGTLTVLHTDVEASTLMTAHLGGRYPEVLATHSALLRATFAAHEGHEVDSRGTRSSWCSPVPRRRSPRPWRSSAPSRPRPGRRAGPYGCASAFTRGNRFGRRRGIRGWTSSAARVQGGRSRRAGAALQVDRRLDRGRPDQRSEPAGPRRTSAQGPPPSRTRLPTRHPGPAG